MKLSLLMLSASLAVALATKKMTYLVTYPDDTPQSEVDKAADAIEESVCCVFMLPLPVPTSWRPTPPYTLLTFHPRAVL